MLRQTAVEAHGASLDKVSRRRKFVVLFVLAVAHAVPTTVVVCVHRPAPPSFAESSPVR